MQLFGVQDRRECNDTLGGTYVPQQARAHARMHAHVHTRTRTLFLTRCTAGPLAAHRAQGEWQQPGRVTRRLPLQ